MEFERDINAMDDRQLQLHNARQIRQICRTCVTHRDQIADHEGRLKCVEDRQDPRLSRLLGAGGIGSGLIALAWVLWQFVQVVK